MKSVGKFVGAVAAGLVATCGVAFAGGPPLPLPEPGSLALVGLAIGVLVLVARKGKK